MFGSKRLKWGRNACKVWVSMGMPAKVWSNAEADVLDYSFNNNLTPLEGIGLLLIVPQLLQPEEVSMGGRKEIHSAMETISYKVGKYDGYKRKLVETHAELITGKVFREIEATQDAEFEEAEAELINAELAAEAPNTPTGPLTDDEISSVGKTCGSWEEGFVKKMVQLGLFDMSGRDTAALAMAGGRLLQGNGLTAGEAALAICSLLNITNPDANERAEIESHLLQVLDQCDADRKAVEGGLLVLKEEPFLRSFIEDAVNAEGYETHAITKDAEGAGDKVEETGVEEGLNDNARDLCRRRQMVKRNALSDEELQILDCPHAMQNAARPKYWDTRTLIWSLRLICENWEESKENPLFLINIEQAILNISAELERRNSSIVFQDEWLSAPE